jgi:gluconate 2-dehydrogenase alpha chain
MAINRKPVDVAVVGLGAAGGVAVLPLCRAGLKVAGIEAGTWMDPHKDFKADEIHNNIRGMVTTGNKIRREAPTIRNSPTATARRGGPSPMMNAVGGTSIHYNAQSWRLKPWDFRTVTEVTKRYGKSYIPEGSTVEDWPIDYDELEPYYDTVEIEVGVSGKAGNIRGTIDKEGNIFEGPRQREYPMPHLRSSDYLDHMKKAAWSLGWNPFHSPAAINSVAYNGHGACGYHGYCSRGGCHLQAKNSTCFTTIPRAQQTKNLAVVDRAQVTRIVAGANGKVTGVSYISDGREYFQPAKAVLVGSYTYENVRLLLLSKSKAYPNGLGNNKGQVGKHHFGHWHLLQNALFPMDINIWYGALQAQAVMIDEWADDSFDHTGLGFIGGASIGVYPEKHPIAAASGSTWGQVPQNWGSQWKKWIHENAGRSAEAYLQGNTFPYETTFLDLDPDVADPLGDPVIRLTTMNRENERRAVMYAQKKMAEWFRAAGATMTTDTGFGPDGPGLSTHAYGGTRMGSNPDTSVVDKWGFSHEAPNLGLLGASVFGTSGARNPTLTVQALAWRTADHLAKNWKSITG